MYITHSQVFSDHVVQVVVAITKLIKLVNVDIKDIVLLIVLARTILQQILRLHSPQCRSSDADETWFAFRPVRGLERFAIATSSSSFGSILIAVCSNLPASIIRHMLPARSEPRSFGRAPWVLPFDLPLPLLAAAAVVASDQPIPGSSRRAGQQSHARKTTKRGHN